MTNLKEHEGVEREWTAVFVLAASVGGPSERPLRQAPQFAICIISYGAFALTTEALCVDHLLLEIENRKTHLGRFD